MLNYLRLLLVGSVLLLVLGLYHKQNSRNETRDLALNGVEQTSTSAANLPFDPFPSGSIKSICRHKSPHGDLLFMRRKQLCKISRESLRIIFMSGKIVDDIKPDLLFRTGSISSHAESPDIPS